MFDIKSKFYAISRTLLLLTFVFVLLVIFVISLNFFNTNIVSSNNDIFAEAVDVSDGNILSANLRAGSSDTLSLTQDVTVSASSFANNNSTFSGVLEGNGHTITITGAGTQTFYNENIITGVLVANLSGTFRNVTINYNASASVVLQNNLLISPANNRATATTYSYTITAGILCGNLTSTGRIENVKLNIGESGYLAAIGFDARGDREEVKSWGSFQYYRYKYLGGAGGVAGGFAGRITSGTLSGCTLNNQGSIFARGSNINVGETIAWDENTQFNAVFNIDSSTDPCRSSAGGVAGEIHGTTSKPTSLIENFHITGDGKVLATVKPNNANYKSAYAGNIVGQTFASSTAPELSLNGVLYKSASISATSVSADNKAGSWLGAKNAGKVYVSNVYRKNELTDPSQSSGRGYNTSFDFTGTGTAPTKAAITISALVKTEFYPIFYVAWGFGAPETPTNITNEIRNDAANTILWYGPSKDPSYGSLDYVEFVNDHIQLAVTAIGSYYISALKHGAGEGAYINVYGTESFVNLKQQTFSVDKTRGNFAIYYFTIDSNPLEMSFTDYPDLLPEKTYDRVAFNFQGSPAGTASLAFGLVWISKYKDIYGTSDSQYDIVGGNGSKSVATGVRAGTYDIAPYRIINTGGLISYDELQDGESIAGNISNGPNIVYTYTKSAIMPHAKITPKDISLQPGTFPFSKQYDGADTVTGLLLGEHYLLDGSLPEDKSSTSIWFDEENSYFADGSNMRSSSVSTTTGDKKVILKDCEVNNPNYKLAGTTDLTLTGCTISKRVVEMLWITAAGPDLLIGQSYLFPYIGSAVLPTMRITNAVGQDNVGVSTATFSGTSETQTVAINALTYNARPAALTGVDKANYEFPLPAVLDGYKVSFSITKKELNLNWSTAKEFQYDSNIRNGDYSCVIQNKATEVFNGDDVQISIVYKNAQSNTVDLRNVGIYSAVASKQESDGEDNYYIAPNDITETDIKITPWTIDLKYWTGNSDFVQDLIYKGSTYIGSEEGLKVDVETENTELTSSSLSFLYKRDGSNVGEVKTVGTYVASTSIVNGSSGNSIYFSLNYTVSALTISHEIKIIPKEIPLVYGNLIFSYDATSKKDVVTVSINPIYIISGDAVNTIKTWKTGDDVTNVGSFLLTVTLNNPSYSIKNDDRTRTVLINKCSITDNTLFVVSPLNSQEYSASEKTPNPQVKYKNVALIKDTDYTITYSDNLNVGTATVNIGGIGNFNGTVSTVFSITRKPLQVSYSIPQTLIYDAKNRSTSIIANISGVIAGDATPQLVYDFWDASNTPTTPLKAGSYKVTVRFTEVNYKMPGVEDRTRTFSILQKDLGIIFSNYDGLAFNNNNHIIEVVFHLDKTFCVEDEGSLALQKTHRFGDIANQQIVDNVRNAGQYQTTVSLTGSSLANYKIVSSNIPGSNESNCHKLSFSVSKRALRVKFTDNEVEFNNNFQKIAFEPVDGFGPLGGDTISSLTTVYYAKDGKSDINGAKNAGTYTVSMTSHSTNYIIAETIPSSVSFKVLKKPVKLYLTINGQPLGESEEFIYGGESQNIGAQIGYGFRANFGPVTGDNSLEVIRALFRGESRIEGAFNVSDDYRITLSLGAGVVNYQLITTVVDPETDSVIERHFAIKPRPIKVIIVEENVSYSGVNSLPLRSGLYNGDGYIAELSTASGIVGSDSVNFLTYVYKYESEYYNGDVSETVNYLAGERTTFKDRGAYYVRSVISGPSNYYIYLEEGNTNEKMFKVLPIDITFAPKNISKTYGDVDPSTAFKVTEQGVGEDSSVSAYLVRDSGENAGLYNYNAILYTGSSNYKVYLNLNAKDENDQPYRFSILVRDYPLNPKPITIEWEPIEPDVSLRETIEVVTATSGSIYIEVRYTRSGLAIPDAGIYDFTSLEEMPENSNINVVFAGANGDSAKGKFIVLGRPVSIRIKDFEKVYDEPDPSFYDPQNFLVTIDDLPTSIKDAYLLNPNGFNWAQLIKVVRAPGENYMSEGYNLTYNFIGEEAKNYRPKIVDYLTGLTPKDSIKLMIHRYEVSISDIELEVNTQKDYDGNNRVDKNLAVLTRASIDLLSSKNLKLFQKGFKPSARFASSTLGEGDADSATDKKVYVSFSVFEEYARNYILPSEFLYRSDGVIKQIEIPVTIEIENNTGSNSLVYGDSPTVKVRYGTSADRLLQSGNPNFSIIICYGKYKNTYVNFVGSDTPTSLSLNVRAVYTDGLDVNANNIRNTGPHTIRLSSVSTTNYLIRTDYLPQELGDPTSSVSIVFSPKLISVVSSGKVYKKPVDNTYDANIDGSHYIINGVLPNDFGTIDISYQAVLNSLLVGSTQVAISQIELSGSQSENYYLENVSLNIPATILSLASVSFSTLYERDFNNQQYVVEPIVASYLSGATLKINGQTRFNGTIGQGLDGEGTIINIEVYYAGLSVGYVKSRTAPKDAGIYSVTCNITNDGEGYIKADAVTSTIKINKVTPVISLSGRFRQEYGSFSPIIATVLAPGLSETLRVDYSFVDLDTGVSPLFVPAGNHLVNATYTPSKTYPINYYAVDKSAELRIIPKQIQVNITGYENGFTYNGENRLEEIIVSFTGVVSEDICFPIVRVNGQSQVLEIINAGTYLIDVSPSNDSYVIVGTSSVYLTINKAQLKVKAVVGQTNAGQFPEYAIEFEGFRGDDSPDSLLSLPGLNLSGNNIGENTAIPRGGNDPNYEYEYVPTIYEVVYQSPNLDKPNYMMYYVLGGILGSIVMIFLVSFVGKKMMLKNMFRSMKKKNR